MFLFFILSGRTGNRLSEPFIVFVTHAGSPWIQITGQQTRGQPYAVHRIRMFAYSLDFVIFTNRYEPVVMSSRFSIIARDTGRMVRFFNSAT